MHKPEILSLLKNIKKNIKNNKNSKITATSLIETVIFMVVISILGVFLGQAISAGLSTMTKVEDINYAPQIAASRMEIILGQKSINGFASFSDICAQTTPPLICNSISGYTVSSLIINNWNGNANLKQISVTVSGKGSNIVLTSLVSNVPASSSSSSSSPSSESGNNGNGNCNNNGNGNGNIGNGNGNGNNGNGNGNNGNDYGNNGNEKCNGNGS